MERPHDLLIPSPNKTPCWEVIGWGKVPDWAAEGAVEQLGEVLGPQL